MHLKVPANLSDGALDQRSATLGRVLLTAALLAGLLATSHSAFAQAGSKRWELLTGDKVYSSPAIGVDGTIYCAARDGKLYALTPGGALRWSFDSRADIVSSPALGRDETVYFGARDNRVYAIAATGVKRWEFLTGGDVDSSPAVGVDGAVYVGSGDGSLYAINSEGSLRWSLALGGGVYSSPAVDADGTIYVGARDNALHAVTPDGRAKWRFDAGADVDSSPAIGPRGVVYFGTGDSRVRAVNADGTTRWEFRTGGNVTGTPIVGPDGTIYAADHGGTLYALTPDGTNKWKATITGNFQDSSPVLAADGTVCLGADDGKIYAFNPGGAVAWTFTTGGEIRFSSPALSRDGTLYIGSADKKIYAVAASAGLENSIWPMFRRDARHSASGFVARELPPGYSPGAPVLVTLRATPPAGTSFYTVEDSPPAGWQVSVISDNGVLDAPDNIVRFGPFTDGAARALTYVATPPPDQTGTKRFQATSTINGADRLMGGEQVLAFVPLHPADNDQFDNWMTIEEVTAYGAAWKRGANWPLGPNPIPARFLDQAIALWLGGETYFYNTNFTAPPQWWTPLPAGAPPRYPAPPLPAPDVVTAKGDAAADMPKFYEPGVPFTVTVTITPSTDAVVCALEELPPEDWSVGEISGGGFYDAARHQIKWGPYFDAQSRTVSYAITPGTNATAIVPFLGIAAFDDQSELVGGRRQVLLQGTGTPPSLTAAPEFDPNGFSLTLTGIPEEIYEIQVSENLVDWTTLATLRDFNGAATFQDPTTPPPAARFYRVFWP